MYTAPQSDVLIAGVGNLLMRDDGVGVHAIRELEKDPPAGAALLDAGTAILSALVDIERAGRVLVIDAVRGGCPPGTVYLLGGGDAEACGGSASLHAMGVIEAVRRLGGRIPEITILGVEPAELDYGMELSPAVRKALPDVVRAARQIVLGWRPAGAGAAMAEVPA